MQTLVLALAPYVVALSLAGQEPVAHPSPPFDRAVSPAAGVDARTPAGSAPAQEEFQRDRLRKSGLPDLADMAAEGREVAQIALNDPYYTYEVPAIQAEKIGSEATLSVFNRRGLVVTIPLTADEWSRIHDRGLTRPSSLPGGDPDPNVIDHAWSAQVGWSGDGTSVTSTAGGLDPGMDIAEFAVRISLRSRPQCRQGAAGAWVYYSFLSCFGPSPT